MSAPQAPQTRRDDSGEAPHSFGLTAPSVS